MFSRKTDIPCSLSDNHLFKTGCKNFNTPTTYSYLVLIVWGKNIYCILLSIREDNYMQYADQTESNGVARAKSTIIQLYVFVQR